MTRYRMGVIVGFAIYRLCVLVHNYTMGVIPTSHTAGMFNQMCTLGFKSIEMESHL